MPKSKMEKFVENAKEIIQNVADQNNLKVGNYREPVIGSNNRIGVRLGRRKNLKSKEESTAKKLEEAKKKLQGEINRRKTRRRNVNLSYAGLSKKQKKLLKEIEEMDRIDKEEPMIYNKAMSKNDGSVKINREEDLEEDEKTHATHTKLSNPTPVKRGDLANGIKTTGVVPTSQKGRVMLNNDKLNRNSLNQVVNSKNQNFEDFVRDMLQTGGGDNPTTEITEITADELKKKINQIESSNLPKWKKIQQIRDLKAGNVKHQSPKSKETKVQEGMTNLGKSNVPWLWESWLQKTKDKKALSEEEPLEEITDGKLEEVEKLKPDCGCNKSLQVKKAEYKGKQVELNKPFRTSGDKKFAVYVQNSSGRVVIVRFGDPNMEIKRDDPERRRSFRARHNCAEEKDITTARYWSCKMWEKERSVSDYTNKACWEGYTAYGTKKLNGKTVPNCIKKSLLDLLKTGTGMGSDFGNPHETGMEQKEYMPASNDDFEINLKENNNKPYKE